MSALQPPDPDTAPRGSVYEGLVEAWIAGELSQDQLIENIDELQQGDPEVIWEVLALLDQNFRRRRISPEVFVSVRKRLERHSIGRDNNAEPPAKDALPAQTSSQPGQSAKSMPPAQPTATVAPDALGPGGLLRGRYRILEVLRTGAGEMLLECMDEVRSDVPGVRQRVVLHVLDEAQARDTGIRQRMCRLQSLSHPAIVRVLDVDSEGGLLFLVRELLGGASLQQLMERNGGAQLAPPIAKSIVQSVANALAYAHSQDICHGDVGARNIFITDVGEIRLKGFECSSRALTATGDADRLAFAHLAYWLLSGAHAPRPGFPDPGLTRLRAPAGITSAQWRVLREALKGRQATPGENVLTVFGAGSAPPAGSVLLQVAQVPPRRHSTAWLVAACAVAAVGASTYSITTREAAGLPVDAMPAAANASTAAPAQQIAATVAPVAKAESPPPPATAEAVVPAPEVSRPRLDLPSRTARVEGDLPVARIWVRRQGPLRGEVSFLWWTESGTALVDEDFREITPRRAVVADGARGVELLVPVMANPSRQQERTFYVRIDAPGSGASIGSRNLMQVAIAPPL